MSFKISTLADIAGADSLMVAKIIDYPLEQAEYKPFAQGRLCVTPQGLTVQLWAFEDKPSPHSSLRAVLRRVGWPAASAQLWSDGRLEVLRGGPRGWEAWPAGCTLQPFWGEDLQGVYWGGTLTFLTQQLEALWGDGCLAPGQTLAGNLYKLSDDPQKPHSGSLFAADFAGGDPCGPASMGKLEIVEY